MVCALFLEILAGIWLSEPVPGLPERGAHGNPAEVGWRALTYDSRDHSGSGGQIGDFDLEQADDRPDAGRGPAADTVH
jgi:hypothetical protein